MPGDEGSAGNAVLVVPEDLVRGASVEEAASDGGAADEVAIRRDALQRILTLIHRLKPLDRQVMLSYLEGMDAASIGEITGISAGNVATKVHRIKAILARRLQRGEHHGNGPSR